jgi:hypothetical protein
VSDTVWERVDERVLTWVATLPPAFTDDVILDFPTRPPAPFAPIEGLDTQEVGEALRRLYDAGFVGGKYDHDSWWELRLAPKGLIYLGEWPDLELAASALTLHHVLRAVAAQAPADEKDAIIRAAGVIGRTVDGVLRETLTDVAHAGGGAAT